MKPGSCLPSRVGVGTAFHSNLGPVEGSSQEQQQSVGGAEHWARTARLIAKDVSRVMELSQLEQDLMRDLALDTHGNWEVFESVKLHHLAASDEEVFAEGHALLRRWAVRGWIVIAATPLQPTDVSSLAEAIDLVGSMGVESIRDWEGCSVDCSF